MACIESKIEFGGKARGACKLQAGAVIAQITDDTPDRRAAGQNELSALEYLCSLKAPTVKHGQSRISRK
jgi:hypothetical protein